MKRNRMICFADTCDRILEIIQWCILFFVIAYLIINSINIIKDTDGAFFMLADPQIGSLLFKFPQSDPYQYYNTSLNLFGSIIFVALDFIVLALTWYIIKILRDILTPMKAARPFTKGVSSNIRKLAVFVLIIGLTTRYGLVIKEYFIFKAYNLNDHLTNPPILSVKLMSSFKNVNVWPTLAAAGMLYFLSVVFAYGEELQTEIDETL